MLTEELQVYADMYKLVNIILDCRERFPKGYRYEFGTELMMTSIRCCKLIQSANSDIQNRAYWLDQFIIEFGSLRLMLRLCRDRKIIQVNPYAEILILIESIGKQITGWRNASRKPGS